MIVTISLRGTIRIGDFRDPSADITFIGGHTALSVCDRGNALLHGIVGVSLCIAQTVRDGKDPVCSVVSILLYRTLCIRSFRYPVHGIVGILYGLLLRIGLCEPVAVTVIGISQGIAQRIRTGQHPVKSIISKGAGLPLFIGNGCHCACRIIGIGGPGTGCIGLLYYSAQSIVGIGRGPSGGIRDRQQPVHGIIGIVPCITGTVRHGCDAGTVIGIGCGITVRILYRHKPVFLIVSVRGLSSLRIGHGSQTVLSVIGIAGLSTVVVCRPRHFTRGIVRIGSGGAILSFFLCYPAFSVIGISRLHAGAVQTACQIPGGIIASLFECAVRIFNFRGTVIVIIGIDRHIAFRIRGSGLSSSGHLFISQRDHATFRIRLLYHTAFPVVLIGYDSVSVFIVPCGHAVAVIVNITNDTACGIRHLRQITGFIVGIGHTVAVRQSNAA